MKNWMKTISAASLLVAGSVAQACTLSAWDATGGTVNDAGPYAGSGGTVIGPRYGGLCSMSTTAPGLVQDNSPGPVDPGVENQMRARFYFFAPASGAGTETIFAAYTADAAITEVYSIGYDAATGAVTVSVDSAAGAAVGTANLGRWNSVEVEWVANGVTGSTTSVWLNSDANDQPTPDFGGGAGGQLGIGSVQLGSIDGTVNLLFDDYESRRTTRIGQLCPGDVAKTGVLDDLRNFTDIFVMFDEISTGGGDPATVGVADFDGNGIVNFTDIFGVFDVISNGLGAC